MRMQFSPEDGDEDAFFVRRDELGEQFAGWLHAQGVPGEPHDAVLLMDWKWSYGDGALDRWQVADVQEFLFEWCVRKLSASPSDAAEIPVSVAAFVEFLAHSGLLGPGDPPARIRRHCEQNAAAFVREMGRPANFGMAKSLFAGGIDAGPYDLGPDGEVEEWEAIGPVRMPTDAARLASVRAAPVLARMRALARYCATPGRPLTTKGHLRLADARHLVELLDTGDGADHVRSAAELPGLAWAVDTAVEAGVVRRHRGKLVAVARFAGLDDLSAYEKLVSAALDLPRRGAPSFLSALGPVLELVENAQDGVLFELLDRGAAGAGVDEIADLTAAVVAAQYPGLAGILSLSIPGRSREHLDRLAELGVIEIGDGRDTACPECDVAHSVNGHVTLTPAGIGAVVALAREAGIEVTERADPALADAGTVVDLYGDLDEDEWSRDVAAWFAAQPDPAAASAALAAAATAEGRETITVLAGLEALGALAGDLAVDAVTPHLGGPQDGLVLNWLLARDAIDPATVDPVRLLLGSIDMMAAALDGLGPKEVVAIFSEGTQDQHLQLLDSVWRLDHPRLAEILDALGRHHPVKVVAKAARKALVRHRSMLADRRSSRG